MKKNLIIIFSVWAFILSTTPVFCFEKLQVFVSILPQKYFLQQIGKDFVDVKVMVLPGASPATYEPKPSQMAWLSKASLYFSIGVPFEKAWLKKISAANPLMKLVRTDDHINKIPMVSAPHGHEGHHHDHESLDPHIWLSPLLVIRQAETILDALKTADPVNSKSFQDNFNAFAEKILKLDHDFKEMFKSSPKRKFMVFHPSWGYFATAYGLEQIPIEYQGKDPKPSQLKDLINHARESGINVVFAQPQFSRKSARLIAREINGKVVLADPLAENWLENLTLVARQFREVLK